MEIYIKRGALSGRELLPEIIFSSETAAWQGNFCLSNISSPLFPVNCFLQHLFFWSLPEDGGLGHFRELFVLPGYWPYIHEVYMLIHFCLFFSCCLSCSRESQKGKGKILLLLHNIWSPLRSSNTWGQNV